MSKVEDRALEVFPVLMRYNDFQMVEEDINKPLREIYQEGYHQAEKDLALTWQDVKAIFLLVQVEWRPNKNEEEIYQEVLKRFKAQKGE